MRRSQSPSRKSALVEPSGLSRQNSPGPGAWLRVSTVRGATSFQFFPSSASRTANSCRSLPSLRQAAPTLLTASRTAEAVMAAFLSVVVASASLCHPRESARVEGRLDNLHDPLQHRRVRPKPGSAEAGVGQNREDRPSILAGQRGTGRPRMQRIEVLLSHHRRRNLWLIPTGTYISIHLENLHALFCHKEFNQP